MATDAETADAGAALRPVATWAPAVDERGRSRLVMRWHIPDPDEALRALLGAR